MGREGGRVGGGWVVGWVGSEGEREGEREVNCCQLSDIAVYKVEVCHPGILLEHIGPWATILPTSWD